MRNGVKVALVDLDGTLADYEGALLEDLRKLRSPGEPLYEPFIPNLPDWYKARIDVIRRQPGWWEELPRLPFGFQLVEAALEVGFTINVVTKGPSNKKQDASWTEKLRWCRKNVPVAVNVTITEDKSGVYGRILIDDYPEYQLGWAKHRRRGLCVIPSNEGNRWFTQEAANKIAEEESWGHQPTIIRYDGNNLDYVLDCMECAYRRHPKEPLILPNK
jgi:hypothetical protein